MIGVPSKRAIGFFGLNRIQLTCKPLKWVTKVSRLAKSLNYLFSHCFFCLFQYPFENFYADDHLSTMMLIDTHHRALDFQYIMWRFDTKDLDIQALNKLDAGPGSKEGESDEDDDLDSQGNEKTPLGKKVE